MKKFHVDEHEETVTIEIGKSVALVLDDLIDRWGQLGYGSCLPIEDDGEWHAVTAIGNALETQLPELFMDGYAERVETAKKKLVEHYGVVER